MLAQRKFFPSFELKLTPKAAIKFAAECLTLFLFASVKEFGFPLALALFCGYVYARQNILALAPAFIIASCVFMLSWWTLLYAVTPILLLVGLYFLFFKLKRNVPLWAVAVTALVGMIPYIVCECVFFGAYFSKAVGALIAVVFTFCAGIAAYAALVRGLSGSATVDEYICGGVLLAAAGFALYGVRIDAFRLFYIALGFAVLLTAVCFKPQTALFTAIILGLGSAAAGRDLSLLAAATALGTVAVTFSPFTRWASALAMLAAQAVMWLLDAYSAAGWQTLVMTAVGVIGALVLPKSVIVRLKDMAVLDNRRAFSGIVNRQGRDIADRLFWAGDVFLDISKSLQKKVDGAGGFGSDGLAREVAKSYCGKCPDRESCASQLGGDIASALSGMADAALSRGKVTILDMPPFITSRCSRMHSLISVINSSAEVYRRKMEMNDGAMLAGRMMSEQFAGVSLVLDSLARDCARPVSFASGDVEFVRSELLKHNVVASELIISTSDDECSVTMLVRNGDARKLIIPKLLSKLLGRRLEVVAAEDRGERRLVYLKSAPVFEIAYGIAEKKRDGEGVSGDSRSILCPSRRKRLFAICDGMGSGEGAAIASRDAVSMIERFYRAGFDNNIILSLVNKLLRISLEDSFSSLDIAVVDTGTGGLDVIKLGAASSFIIRRDGMEVLSCTLPPAGILDNVQPLTSRYQLYDGDMLVMMSDGVCDALETKGVAQIVEATDTVNPQVLADALLEGALDRGADDDCTVLVTRLFSV